MAITNEDLNQFNDNVVELCKQTTGLHNEIKGQKQRFNEKLVTATEKADKAAQHESNAQSARVAAINAQTEASRQAGIAEQHAKRAVEISGIQNVEQAVQTALDNAKTFARTRAEFDAQCIANKSLLANGSSGFYHLGMSHKDGKPINNGLTCLAAFNAGSENWQRNAMWFYPYYTSAISGKSVSKHPVIFADGVEIEIDLGNGATANGYGAIKFPHAPDGTKTFDPKTQSLIDHMTHENPRYSSLPTDKNEARSRAFGGMVVNHNFRNGSAAWSFAGNESHLSFSANTGLTFLGTHEHAFSVTQGIDIQEKEYELEVVVTEITAGRVEFIIYGDGAHDGTVLSINKAGVHKVIFNPAYLTGNFSSDNLLAIRDNVGGLACTIKSVSLRPATEKVIVTREDFVFIETWHQKLSGTGGIGGIFHNGGVQYGSGSVPWCSSPAKRITEHGIKQGFSAFGGWDSETVGRFVPFTDLDTDKLKRAVRYARNNVYLNPHDGELYQVCWRVRVCEGLGVEPQNLHPIKFANVDAMTYYGSKFRIFRQEEWQESSDYSESRYFTLYGNSGSSRPNDVGMASANGTNGISCAIPVALVGRYNQGAYHEIHNPNGTRTCNTTDGAWSNATWYVNNIDVPSLEMCMYVTTGNPSDNLNWGAYLSSGYIGSDKSSRVDRGYFDGIVSGKVQDLRLDVKKSDSNVLLSDAISKACEGHLRGYHKRAKIKITFTRLLFAGDKTMVSSAEGGHHNWIGENGGLILHNGKAYKVYPHDNDYWIRIKKYDPATGEFLDGDFTNELYLPSDHVSGRKMFTYIPSTGNDIFTVPFPRTVSGGDCLIFHDVEYIDTATYAEVVANPDVIANVLTDGFSGVWTGHTFKGNGEHHTITCFHKAVREKGRLFTEDNGISWTWMGDWTGLGGASGVANKMVDALHPSTRLSIYYYDADLPFTNPCGLERIYGEYGNFVASAGFQANYWGNRLQRSLTGKVGVSGTSGAGHAFYALDQFAIRATNKTIVGDLNDKTTHKPLELVDTSSTGFKAMYYLTVVNNLVYLTLTGSELVYTDGLRIPNDGEQVDGSGRFYYRKGKLYRITGGLFAGKVVRCNSDFDGVIDTSFHESSTGLATGTNGYDAFTMYRKGMGWGDDGLIFAQSSIGHKYDANGNRVLMFTHRSQMPIGIADVDDGIYAMKSVNRLTRDFHQTRPSELFHRIDDVPQELKEFYHTKRVNLGFEDTELQLQDESGHPYKTVVPMPIFGEELTENNRPLDNGSTTCEESQASWSYHDEYVTWLEQCAAIEHYNNTPQFEQINGEDVEINFDPIPLPPKPQK